MSNGLIIFLYVIAVYGLSNMMVHASGPFRLFERIRNGAEYISEHFGQLFNCMMCLPANLGWIFCLINWFFIPTPITPFCILLWGTGLWWVALIGDICFASGMTWIIHNIELFFESIAEGTSSKQEDDDNDTMILND